MTYRFNPLCRGSSVLIPVLFRLVLATSIGFNPLCRGSSVLIAHSMRNRYSILQSSILNSTMLRSLCKSLQTTFEE